MRTHTFLQVLRRAAGLAGLNPDLLSTDEQRDLVACLNTRAQAAWARCWWPEWTVAEQRWFAPQWTFGETPKNIQPLGDVATFVFWPRTGKYYQWLGAWRGWGVVPTLSQVGGVATLDVDAGGGEVHGCATGDLVMIGGVDPAGYNQMQPVTVTSTTAFEYAVVASTGAVISAYAGRWIRMPTNEAGEVRADVWAEAAEEFSGADWEAGEAVVVGDVRRDPEDGYYYQCIVAHTTSWATWILDSYPYWQQLVPFPRKLLYEATHAIAPVPEAFGDVKAVWDRNPQFLGARTVPHWLVSDGLLVRTQLATVWLEHRRRCPTWDGTTWGATATYAVGDVVWFSPDYYECVTATTAGQSPLTTPASWSVLEFPAVLTEAVALGAAADYQQPDLSPASYKILDAQARAVLDAEILRVERDQGQTKQLRVRSRTPSIQ
jgi:hypothetical protein